MIITGNINVQNLFDSIKVYDDLENMIKDGECEGQYLECKAPQSLSSLDKNLEAELAEELSGISNSGGGIIIFGMATDNKDKKELDMLTQIEPIGLVNQFANKLALKIPFLTQPSVKSVIKIIREKPIDTKGVIIMLVPPNPNDPIKSIKDGKFYIRTGERTPEMPYETLKRMFLGSSSPDLQIKIDTPKLIIDTGNWELQVAIENMSTYPSKNTKVSIKFPGAKFISESISASGFKDASSINKGEKIFFNNTSGLIYRGLTTVLGKFVVTMKKGSRKITVSTTIYAESMRPKVQNFIFYLNKTRTVKLKELPSTFLY